MTSPGDSTVNHDAWHKEHVAQLATDAAPGETLPTRPRIDGGMVVAALAFVVFSAAFIGLIVLVGWVVVRGGQP